MLMLISPTGTGYVNYCAVAATQYLTLPDPGAHANADLVREYANEKNGQRWASIPVAVFFTRDFVELYRSERWRRYYSEEAFLAHMREVIQSVEVWEKVLHQTAGRVGRSTLRSMGKGDE